MDTKELRKLEQKVDELPLLPQVLVRILQLDSEDNEYFEQFELLANEDPTLAVRVIALANSAVSSPVSPVVAIKEALARVGVAAINSLVMSLAVQRVLMPTTPDQVRLWKHSIYVAVASRAIAKITPALDVEPSQAYVAGLLHDLGRFTMLEHAAPSLLAVDESHWQTPGELIAADLELYKFTHCELGYLACKHWGLPDVLADVVRNHHQDLGDSAPQDTAAALTRCVQIADRLSISVLENDEVEQEHDEAMSAASATIAETCVPTVFERQHCPPALLFGSIPRIQSQARVLLAGLGFASSRSRSTNVGEQLRQELPLT